MGVLFLGVPYYIEDLKGDPSLENYPSEALGSAESGRVPKRGFSQAVLPCSELFAGASLRTHEGSGRKEGQTFPYICNSFRLVFC